MRCKSGYRIRCRRSPYACNWTPSFRYKLECLAEPARHRLADAMDGMRQAARCSSSAKIQTGEDVDERAPSMYRYMRVAGHLCRYLLRSSGQLPSRSYWIDSVSVRLSGPAFRKIATFYFVRVLCRQSSLVIATPRTCSTSCMPRCNARLDKFVLKCILVRVCF